ncbi:MAG: ATP-dependent zinc metalloprotease FtsH [Candidatus Omnitrophica bacterium]|nr:ATP-dependent zinc metalloprotease FtsH [Candidatus Omnitrophota bacterium]
MTENNKQKAPPLKSRKPSRGIPPHLKQKGMNNNFFFWVVLGLLVLMALVQNENTVSSGKEKVLSYSQLYSLVKDKESAATIEKLELYEGPESRLSGKLKTGEEFKLIIPSKDEGLLTAIRENVSNFSVKTPSPLIPLALNILPILLIVGLIWFFANRGNQMGNKIWSFGKSRAKVNNKDTHKITFKNVAGVDEAKEELQEIIEFLKDPKKFQRLGGKIPKGVLLVGHPGTGKTLLAKAVAGEAEVPFFSLSGSDFVEMFVGVGASRVRDLFEQARKASTVSGKGAIVFIDEIDAVGRLRFSGIGGGNDEREQTLNALLVEMDGFAPQSGVIIIAATNRPDTLDPALLRPGRFDRQIVVTLPDIKGREGILRVHTQDIKVAANVDFARIAQLTVYFSGADLANVCNEAALLAARKNKEFVDDEDFLAAIERVTMGPEKKSRTISKKEKEQTAYHEAGHALLSLLVEEVDTFTKVSIIPRGMAGGYTLTPPTEDRHYHNKKELFGSLIVLLGGMVGEEIYMNDSTTGVSNDLERVASIAKAMICEFGMNDNLGRMAFGQRQKQHFLGRDMLENKDYSEETAKNIDNEVKKLVDTAYQRAKTLLTENRDKLEIIAQRLIEKEIISIDETRALLGIPDGMNPVKLRKDYNTTPTATSTDSAPAA